MRDYEEGTKHSKTKLETVVLDLDKPEGSIDVICTRLANKNRNAFWACDGHCHC